MARFTIDPGASRVWIEARSSLHPIHSETAGVEGWVDAEPPADGGAGATAVSAGHVELKVEALSSGNRLYDREMHRRVDARRFPTITGDLKEMKATGAAGRYEVEGTVTFRGVIRPATDEMEVTAPTDGRLVLEGSHTFDVREFGMQPPKILALRVYPDVAVRVRLVANREAG